MTNRNNRYRPVTSPAPTADQPGRGGQKLLRTRLNKYTSTVEDMSDLLCLYCWGHVSITLSVVLRTCLKTIPLLLRTCLNIFTVEDMSPYLCCWGHVSKTIPLLLRTCLHIFTVEDRSPYLCCWGHVSNFQCWGHVPKPYLSCWEHVFVT